jgi:hypothetical protein
MTFAKIFAGASRFAVVLILGIAILIATSGRGYAADACDNSAAPPDCQQQIQSAVPYSGWESNTWAYYCTGDHPFYWGPSNSSDTGNFQVLTPNYTFIESIFAENGSPNKMDALFTNWSIYTQQLVVALACSDQPPPQAQVCNNPGNPVADPGCAESNAHVYCSGRVPVCFTLYEETCTGGQTYQCTNETGLVVWCQPCGASAKAHGQSHRTGYKDQSSSERMTHAVRYLLGAEPLTRP